MLIDNNILKIFYSLKLPTMLHPLIRPGSDSDIISHEKAGVNRDKWLTMGLIIGGSNKHLMKN